MAELFNFKVENDDIVVKFSCANHAQRIGQIVTNLQIDRTNEQDCSRMMSRFATDQPNVRFVFADGSVATGETRREAVFFEQTDYPIIVKGKTHTLADIDMILAGHGSESQRKKGKVISDEGELYGTLNFKNQVGETDFRFRYKMKGSEEWHELVFETEVLSYKLDYRSDLRTIIADVEYEYAMLSYSFLKDTYLNYRRGNSDSTDLIWWQVFRSCYEEILRNARLIIDRPKRRLRPVPKYERAERMAYMPLELENEYVMHQDCPAYLYRTEELILSHDTVENRFLKYALNQMLHKFVSIRNHIMTALRLTNPDRVTPNLQEMEDELLRMTNHTFFRGVGQFKGFSQDSLVMKQGMGYKTILEKWIELQQGYELADGVLRLEVKDISDLYEIWCFIKVKNLVSEVMGEMGMNMQSRSNGKVLSSEFIPQLVHGGSVAFINEGGVELASVSYNAEVEMDDDEESSKIEGTASLTTVQRPDIVLRLSKDKNDEVKYTYLFDAKYRIHDNPIKGQQVPPPDAVNQLHRYRDAIYYNQSEGLRKEIVAGYVLFPGNVDNSAMEDGSYHYQAANEKIGIGAFPLKPDKEKRGQDGNLLLNPNNSEQALRKQIRKWLSEENLRKSIVEHSIPQHGLEYIDEDRAHGSYYLSTCDAKVNANKQSLLDGSATEFFSGYSWMKTGVDFSKIKFFALVDNHHVYGYYAVKKAEPAYIKDKLDEAYRIATDKEKADYNGFNSPIRIRLELGEYQALEHPFTFGVNNVSAGISIPHNKFRNYCNGKYEKND